MFWQNPKKKDELKLDHINIALYYKDVDGCTQLVYKHAASFAAAREELSKLEETYRAMTTT